MIAEKIGPEEVGGPVNKRMTVEEIQDTFKNEWILIKDPSTDESFRVIEGMVIWHGIDRDTVYKKARELGIRHSAFLYTGKRHEKTAILL
jgi:hypothetical protein